MCKDEITNKFYHKVPSVDGEIIPEDIYILMNDEDYLKKHDILSRDVILGVNNNEGDVIYSLLEGTGKEKKLTGDD